MRSRKRNLLRGIPRKEREVVIEMLKEMRVYEMTSRGYYKRVHRGYVFREVYYRIKERVDKDIGKMLRETEIGVMRRVMGKYRALEPERMSAKEIVLYIKRGGLHRMMSLSITKLICDRYDFVDKEESETRELEDVTREQLKALSELKWGYYEHEKEI